MSGKTEQTEIFLAQMSARMRMARKLMEATQEDAARMCGISPRSYKEYELGRRAPPADVVMRFCLSFKMSPESLLFGTHSKEGAPAGAELIDEIAAGLLSVFARVGDDQDVSKKVKLARYAWESARAKGRDFADELRELNALTA